MTVMRLMNRPRLEITYVMQLRNLADTALYRATLAKVRCGQLPSAPGGSEKRSRTFAFL